VGFKGEQGRSYDYETMEQLRTFIDNPTDENWTRISLVFGACYLSDRAQRCHLCPFLSSSFRCRLDYGAHDRPNAGERLALSIQLLAKLESVWGCHEQDR